MSEHFKPIPRRDRNYPPVKYRLMDVGRNRLSIHEKTELDQDFNLDLKDAYAVVAVDRAQFDLLKLRVRKANRRKRGTP